MKWILDKIGGAVIGQFLRIFLAIILPIVAPLSVAAAGIFQNVDWYLWISAAFVSFWFCISSVNQFSQMSSRMSSKWKLSQHGINVVSIADKNNIPAYWTDIQLEFLFHNRAEFPIEYEFEYIGARVGGQVSISKNYINRGGIIDPGCPSTFTTEHVPVGDISALDEVSGEWSVSIKYGRPGAMRHRLLRKYHISGRVDENRLPQNVRWYSLPASEIQVIK